MSAQINQDRYSRWSIRLHWFMLLLLVAVYALMEFRGYFPKGSATRDLMKTWHFMLGLSVLILVVVRLVARIVGGVPPIHPAPVRWQANTAKLMHLALYLLMIGMPIVGWLTLSATGKPIPLFGLELPALLEKSKSLAHNFKEIHETAATVGYYLIGAHAAAALFHHYRQHDNTLLRMLPNRRQG